MREGYHIGRYRGCYCANLYAGGKRQGRFTLGTNCKEDAERQVRGLNAGLARDRLPATMTVDDVFGLYIADRKEAGKPSVFRMEQCRELIKPHFGALHPDTIDKKLCNDYIKKRRNVGVSNATIRTELTYLAVALKFGVDNTLIPSRPRIWRPPVARARAHLGDYHLKRDDASRLLDEAVQTPHLALFITLSLATAGRPLHILQLTWDRVDFHRGTINLDDPDNDPTNKGRALVPMNDAARAALVEARKVAETAFVVEFNGAPLKRVKGALERAAARAGVRVSPRVLRHTAGVWMAERNVPLEQIAQYLGHTNVEITRKHYARYSPSFLSTAASHLQVVRGSVGSREPKKRNAA